MPDTHSAIENDPAAHWAFLSEHLPISERGVLENAYHLAARVHYAQFRKTGADSPPIPYIVHPLRVARIVAAEWQRAEPSLLAACLLHDVIEDCPETLREVIESEILRVEGKEVASAVQILTKPLLPNPCPPDARAAREARYFKALFAAPEWVRLVKCADRVDNLRDARALGDRNFWERYSSETIGWHLYLARETSPVAEVTLFKALVEGERALRGRVPIWADGHLIDPVTAAMIPREVAHRYGVIGLDLRGDTIRVGMRDDRDSEALFATQRALRATPEAPRYRIEPVALSEEAVQDALAGVYGTIQHKNETAQGEA